MKNKIPKVFYITGVLSLIILVIGFIVLFGINENDPEYGMVVIQKPTEKARNISLYLPTPLRGKNLPPKLLDRLRQDNVEAQKFGSFAVTIKQVDTKYGNMLNIVIPELNSETNAAGVGVDAVKYHYYRLFSSVGPDEREPLEPIVGKGREVKSYIYATWDGPPSLRIYLRYKAFRRGVTPLGQTLEVGTMWFLGEKISRSSTGDLTVELADMVELKKQGWNEVPIWVFKRGK